MSFEEQLESLNEHASKIEGIENHLPAMDLGEYWQIDNYNVSNLVMRFFKLARYGTNFKKINNASDLILDETQYRESMAVYGAMAAIVAISLSVFLILFCCCNCMFRSSAASRTPKYKGQKRSKSSFFCGVVIFFIAIAGAATFAVGIIGEVRLHNGANQVCETVDNVSNKTKSIHDETKKINKELDVDTLLSKLENPIKNVKKNLDQLGGMGNANLEAQINEISANYENIKTQVKQAKEKIVKNLNNDLLEKMITYIKPVQENCPKVTKYLRLSSLLVLIVLAISSLFFILGLFNNCFRSIVTILGYLFLNILIVFGIISFLTLVAGSDFCMHSKPLVKKYVDTPVLDYYLYCNETSSNLPSKLVKRSFPVFNIDSESFSNIDASNLDLNKIFIDVKKYVNDAKKNAQMFNDTLSGFDSNIKTLCDAYTQSHPNLALDPKKVCQELTTNVHTLKEVIVGGTGTESLLQKMEAVSESVEKIIDTVECKSLSKDIDGSLTNLCTTIYEAFFFFLMNSVSAVLCFYIMLIFTIWMLF